MVDHKVFMTVMAGKVPKVGTLSSNLQQVLLILCYCLKFELDCTFLYYVAFPESVQHSNRITVLNVCLHICYVLKVCLIDLRCGTSLAPHASCSCLTSELNQTYFCLNVFKATTSEMRHCDFLVFPMIHGYHCIHPHYVWVTLTQWWSHRKSQLNGQKSFVKVKLVYTSKISFLWQV